MPSGFGSAGVSALTDCRTVCFGEAAGAATSFTSFSTENLEIICSLPLSKSWKSSIARLPTAWPGLSRTTTGTGTRFTPDLNVNGASFDVTSAPGGEGACAESTAQTREPARMPQKRFIRVAYSTTAKFRARIAGRETLHDSVARTYVEYGMGTGPGGGVGSGDGCGDWLAD